MSRREKLEIYSVFGQIDAAAAESMIAEGKIVKIPFEDIPTSAAYDDQGRRAFFAIRVPPEHQAELTKRTLDLYA